MKTFLTLLLVVLGAGTLIAQPKFSKLGIVKSSITGPVSVGPTGYYRTISTDFTKVPNTDQTDFPVLITGTYTYLKNVANGGKAAGKNNIYFSSSTTGSPLLAFDIEKYDSTTGAITAWVKVSTLSHTVATNIYIHYGDATSTYQGDGAGTFSNSFAMVWHMAETLTAAGQTVADASGHSLPLTAVGTWSSSQQSAGKIGGALIPSKVSGDYFTFTAKTLNTDYSLSGWLSLGVLDQHSIWFGHTASGNYINFFGGQQHYWNGSADDIGSDSTATQEIGGSPAWVYYVITRSGTALKMYFNGSLAKSNTNGNNLRVFNAIARQNTETSEDIRFDENRIASAARSADWIKTEYNNQNAPSTFYSVGSEVSK